MSKLNPMILAMLNEKAYNVALGNKANIGTTTNHDVTSIPDDTSYTRSVLDDDVVEEDNTEENVEAPSQTLFNPNADNYIPKDVMNMMESATPIKYASDYTNYYNESAMKAKERNSLPDSEFGIPRLRKYPLNDEKHVRLAIQMFGHCKDPKDKETLANKIFAKVKEFDMDVKIGKGSSLYDYAPKSLQEAAMNEALLDDPGQDETNPNRTKKEIVTDHLNRYSKFYNSLFFSKDFAKSLYGLKEYSFLQYFYPNFKTENLFVHLKGCIAGLAEISDLNDIEAEKNVSNAWFKVDTTDDFDHVVYCLKLYSVLRKIVLDKDFAMDKLSEEDLGIMADWEQYVYYYYDLFKDCDPDTKKYYYYAQKLYDIFWSCNDNPYDKDNNQNNMISLVNAMASTNNDGFIRNMNESTELLDKNDNINFLVQDLGMDDSIFLLPSKLEYPILNQSSVRMAMDNITHIDKEDRAEYAKNLNRMYNLLACDFSISVDHPYAKYASKEIIDHMHHILAEGDTAVSDDGTSGGTESYDPHDPWYKRLAVNSEADMILYPDRNMGPRAKENASPDYTRQLSIE